ncbi:GntR family transcriptional regulator [Phycicoccus sp. SLBN-51]|jgi:DNA-binding transcriptional regulator YhcF (GntR family)|uniref:GntR family transcriptional regulator n=1 Tax=Phycicoccus sp. SLBN-51 TaxID=2768447 RepID=UPI001150C632|nr:GntR family transcriptional regulator [Phycicoccus sp. SLBN-51]TQJ48584.1 GntR family transcriptional regulator [Phycicoccus sp. SLBN-51]
MTLPALSVDQHGSVAPFEQIRAQLAVLIESGTLAEGERLPTVRGLAADLGVAVNTVARAYRELEAEGLVATASRAGTVVAPGAQRDEVALQRAAAAFAERAARSRVTEEEALALVRKALRSRRG